MSRTALASLFGITPASGITSQFSGTGYLNTTGAGGGGGGGGVGTVMPDIAAWGDSLTAQNGYWSGIGDRLSAYYNQTVDVYPGGRGSQRSDGIAIRQGGRPGQVMAVRIPASGSITINFMKTSQGYNALTQGTDIDALCNYDANPEQLVCTIGNANIPGILTKSNNGNNNVDCWPFIFTRTGSGAATDIATGEHLVLATGNTYRQRGHVLRAGHDSRTSRPCTGGSANMRTTTGPITQKMYDWITAPLGEAPRAVVVGLQMADPVYLGSAFSSLSADVDYIFSDLTARFGADVIDMRSYTSSKQILVDSGIITAAQNPSAQDQQGIDGRYPPRSIQSGIHLSAAAQTATGIFVANHIISQDWRRQN